MGCAAARKELSALQENAAEAPSPV